MGANIGGQNGLLQRQFLTVVLFEQGGFDCNFGSNQIPV